MLKSKSNTQETQENVLELEQSHTNAQSQEDKSESGELVKFEHVEDTPFTIVERTEIKDEKNCFLAIGQSRVTTYETREKINELLEKPTWRLITDMVVDMVNKTVETKLNNQN